MFGIDGCLHRGQGVSLMLTKVLQRAAVAASASMGIALVALPAPAHGQTLDVGVTASVSVTAAPNPDDGLDGAFGDSPTTILQNLLCPVVNAVTGVTTNIPGVGPILDQLPGIVCAIGVAGYVYRTTYYPTSGPPVVKYTKAVIGVPALIDVDGKGLPDFTGLVGIALPGLSLQLSRSLLFSASEKVTIEAVAIVPGVANTYVGFGQDGSKAGTAKHWKAALTIAGLSSEGAELKLAIDTLNAPSSLGVLGEMFTGPDPDAPDNTYRGLAAFSPVPDKFTTRILAAQSRQEVHVASTPTTLTADVDILSPGRAQNVHAVADKLPSTVDVVHSTAGGKDTTTYDADAPIARLTATYHDTVDGDIETAAALDVWGVPKHLSFEQAAEKTTVTTGTGKIDRIQARFARGSEVGPLDPGTAPFAKFHRTTADDFTAALQLSDLRSVSINQGTPYGGQLVFANAPGHFPFTADDDTSSLHLEGSLSNLPLDTTVVADVDNGTITFDGHGTGIDEIALKATRPTPFFTKATRIDLTVTDLPALITVDYKQTNGAVTFTAPGNGVGSVSLLASNGAGAPAVPPGDYASYEDTGTLYRVYARILGIKEVTFNANPLSGTIKTTVPQVMNLFVNLADATHDLEVTGRIDKVPSHIDFGLNLTDAVTVFEYDSHGQHIDEVTLDGTGLYNLANGSPLPLGIDTLHAEIEDVPDHMRAVLSTADGTSFSFSPTAQNEGPNGDKIGRILLQAYPQAAGPHHSVAGHQTAYGNLQTGQFTADIHDIGRTFFDITDAGQNMGYDISSAPLDYEFVADDGTFLKGQISNPTPATINLDMSNKVDVHYRATTDTQIDSITLKTNMAGGYIDADLQNIAPDVKVCFSGTNKACQPGFVPRPTLTTDGKTFNMPPALFDFALTPANRSGGLWPNRFELDGTYCFDASNPAVCLDPSQKKERIKITDLRFGRVAVGAGFRSFDCTGCTAGRVYGYFDTDNTLISGDVKYFEADDDGAFVHYHTDSDSAGIEAEDKVLFADYCLPTCIDYDDLTLADRGSFTCRQSPHLDIDIPVFDDIDILSGSFISFC